MLNLTDFRKDTKAVFDACHKAPVQVKRGKTIYLVMTQAHYVDLINKVKYPQLMEHPVQTIVQIVHKSTD